MVDNVDYFIFFYVVFKKSNELMAYIYSYLFGIFMIGFCFFIVYGFWGWLDMVFFFFIEVMFKGEFIKVFNYGNMVCDFIYVDDIVEGVVCVIDNLLKGNLQWIGVVFLFDFFVVFWKVYNIGNNNLVKLMDFIKVIEEKLGIIVEKNMMDI